MVVTLAYIALFLVFSWVILRINQKSDSLSKSVFIAIFLGLLLVYPCILFQQITLKLLSNGTASSAMVTSTC
ncbi:C4-dicarboxylate transport protein [Salmonella enterica subsp. enterica serovar Daytona]|uniref:C4-dicarboxylate transport protein n=1 Tax=Salmonella enterica subsp. enterica serovar Daytona TaxID=1962639 RepID=A0A447JHB1_SALET|nr:C4-dicarboxylate transport protein [Salmonella enterica subsp. enterica serovar Daytona]